MLTFRKGDMEEEIGTIVEVSGDQAVVEMETGEYCSHCAAKSACQPMGGTRRRVVVNNIQVAQVGDRAALSYRAKSRIMAASLVFLLPVICLFLGYFLGNFLFEGEGAKVISALVGLSIGFLVLRVLNTLMAGRSDLAPQIIRVEHRGRREKIE